MPVRLQTNEANTFLNKFNETIEKWTSCTDNYTLEMLCRKPQIDSWSLGQVYTHIAEDTNYFVEQMKTCLSNNDNIEEEMRNSAKAMFSNNEFPDILISTPSGNLVSQPQSKDELLQSLGSIKEEVNKLFADSNFSQLSGKTKHPGLGFFNALQWLQFAEMHMRHHFRQKKRIDDKLFLHKN